MRKRMALVAAFTSLALPGSAAAHVELTPGQIAPGSFTLFTVLSPNESEKQALTGLRLLIPEGLGIDAVADTPGFTSQFVADRRHRISALNWQGGRVAPGKLALFRFSGAAPAKGTLRLTGIQRFADGSTKTWRTPVLTVADERSGRDALTLGLAGAALALVLVLALLSAVVLARGRRIVR
jgi:uncharacterized protein YcnI